MGPSNNLIYLLYHLGSVINKQSNQALEEQLGIGLSQYKILMVAGLNPKIRQSAIARSLGQSEASISRQIKLLINKGLLASTPDSDDKRSLVIFPTTLGAQVTEASSNILNYSLSQDLHDLNDDYLPSLTNSLKELHAQVCKKSRLGACNHMLGT